MHRFDRNAKLAVVLVFTACWLIVVVMRAKFAGGETNLDASWLLGLAAYFQQGGIGGRDFHFTYGPVAQLLAWLATSVTLTQNAFDSYRMLTLFFTAACAALTGAVLLLLNGISWKHTVLIYSLTALLNLYWGIPNFRIILTLLCVAFTYRILAAANYRRQVAWAVATGFICFMSQLVTADLGIYGGVIAIGTLTINFLFSRERRTIRAGAFFLATFGILNVGLDLFFRLTSPSYRTFLGYQRYAIETIVGYNNTMGIAWQLDQWPTIFLTILAVFTVVTAILAAFRTPLADRSLLLGLILASLISIKSAFVRSDSGHILFGAGPLLFTFLLLPKKEWTTRIGRIIWGAFVVGLLFLWPGANWNVYRDFLKVIEGEVSLASAIREMHSVSVPAETVLPPELVTAEFKGRRSIPILPFPYDDYIPIVLRRPLFAPVLQTFSAPTEALQAFYIEAIERQGPANLDIVYSLDTVAVWPVDGVQSISRVPKIFEYLYTHFQLGSSEEHQHGHYILVGRNEQKKPVIQNLEVTTTRSDEASGSLRLKQPTDCGLIQFDLTPTYSPARLLFRPSGVTVTFKKGNEPIWSGYVRVAQLNHQSTTYISLVKPRAFYKLFESSAEPSSIPTRIWDNVEYGPEQTDILGTAAQKIELKHLRCIDPDVYVQDTSIEPEEMVFPPELITGNTALGYAILTPESLSVPAMTARIARAGGLTWHADLIVKPSSTNYSTPVKSIYSKDIGIALANPSKRPIDVRITYSGERGDRTANVNLPPGHQTARLLAEFLPPGAEPLAGTLEMSSNSRFSAVAIQFIGDRFQELASHSPVRSNASGPTSIVFPQFAMYGGWATTLILSNSGETTATGSIKVFSSLGVPMAVSLNGVTSNQFKYSVPPSESYTFSPGAASASSSQ